MHVRGRARTGFGGPAGAQAARQRAGEIDFFMHVARDRVLPSSNQRRRLPRPRVARGGQLGTQIAALASPNGSARLAAYWEPTQAHTTASKPSSYDLRAARDFTAAASGIGISVGPTTFPSASLIALNSAK